MHLQQISMLDVKKKKGLLPDAVDIIFYCAK